VGGDLGPGDLFGEIALLHSVHERRRSRTMDTVLLELGRDPFIEAVTTIRPAKKR